MRHKLLSLIGIFLATSASHAADGPTVNVDFEGRTKRFVSLFQVGREHLFDPFHECANSARQVAPMRYDQGDVERLMLKIG
jgi:hypothetical protein